MIKAYLERKKFAREIVLVPLLLILVGCGSNSDDETLLLQSPVNAVSGGVFSTEDELLNVVIPAGALSEDTELRVMSVPSVDEPTGNLASVGPSYEIQLDSEIVSPIELQFTIDQSPTHPKLGESAYFADGEWTRSPSNYFRTSDNTIISLVSRDGVFSPVFRTLQTESGDFVERGREVFLYESFDNQAFFGGEIGLHTLLNNLAPSAAVGVGAQIDISRVPQGIANVLLGDDFAAKSLALEDPAVTRDLLRAEAVVGVTATFADDGSNTLTSAGITCALCHAVVTPTEFELAEGQFEPLPIGPLQLDGTPNTIMDVGKILSLTPFANDAGAATIEFLQAFGAGRFDARSLPDNPLDDGLLNPTSIPPLWNFIDLAEQNYGLNWDGLFTSNEDPDNALASRAELVYDLVMHANGGFGTSTGTVPFEGGTPPSQAQLDAFAQAEANQPGNDVELQALLDVQAWQRSLASPAPQPFDNALAEEGFRLFNGKAGCVECHSTAEFTGPERSAAIVLQQPLGILAEGVKTPGLRGVQYVSPYFHDDSAATLMDVLDIYSGRIVAELTEPEKTALVEYLKSL